MMTFVALEFEVRSAMSFQFFHSTTDELSMVKIPAIGLELAVRLPHDATGGALTLMETVNAPGFGPPLHRHPETEVFRVLEGEYLYEVEGKRFRATTGDVVSVPGGTAHTFTNLSASPSRQLVMMLPAMDAMKFFVGLGEIMKAGRPEPSVLNAYGASWGVEFLGPPIKATS
jgi:quercetin dioxygenase-like cupin family protein